MKALPRAAFGADSGVSIPCTFAMVFLQLLRNARKATCSRRDYADLRPDSCSRSRRAVCRQVCAVHGPDTLVKNSHSPLHSDNRMVRSYADVPVLDRDLLPTFAAQRFQRLDLQAEHTQ